MDYLIDNLFFSSKMLYNRDNNESEIGDEMKDYLDIEKIYKEGKLADKELYYMLKLKEAIEKKDENLISYYQEKLNNEKGKSR